MSKFFTVEEVYTSCEEKGLLIPQATVDINKIRSNIIISEEDLASAKDAILKKRWNSAYKLYYDVLHILVESFLCFDRIKSMNHQCLFSYLCLKHQELEFSWEFFEKMRTKRNGINYYGQPVDYADWKGIELQFNPYISTLKKEIEKKLLEHK